MFLPLTTRFGADPLLDLEIANKRYVDNSSGGGGTSFSVVKKVDEVRNNTITLSDDSELFFTGKANATYLIISWWNCKSVASANLRYAFSLPSGATGLRSASTVFRSNTGQPMTADLTATDFLSVDTTNEMFGYAYSISMGSTAGIIQLQWAQTVAQMGDTIIQRGSALMIHEVEA